MKIMPGAFTWRADGLGGQANEGAKEGALSLQCLHICRPARPLALHLDAKIMPGAFTWRADGLGGQANEGAKERALSLQCLHIGRPARPLALQKRGTTGAFCWRADGLGGRRSIEGPLQGQRVRPSTLLRAGPLNVTLRNVSSCNLIKYQLKLLL